jgi:WD40 repeat protein
MLEYKLSKRLDLIGNIYCVRCITFSPDGNFLAAGIDHEVVVWATTSWTIEFVQQSPSRVLSLAWEGLYRLYFGSENGFLTTVIISEKVGGYSSELIKEISLWLRNL